MTRGAYVELNFVHGEMLPSFAWIAEAAGVDLDFFLLRENLDASDPFAGLDAAKPIRPIDAANPHDPCAGELNFDGASLDEYDFVVVGTAEPRDRVAWAQTLGVPALLVLHNPPSDLPQLPNIDWAVLTDEAVRRHPDAELVCVHPFHAGPIPTAERRRHTFAVAGNHQTNRRNYGSLLRALVRLRDRGITPDELEIHLIGRWSDDLRADGVGFGLDGGRILDAAYNAGVDAYLHGIATADVGHEEFRVRLGACRYSLPLIDDFYVDTRRFFTGKGAGGFSRSIALHTVPIVNQRFADLHGLTACHSYPLDQVEVGIESALAGDDDHLVRQLAEHRATHLDRSAEAFRAWVASL